MKRTSLMLVDDDDAYRTVMAEELGSLGFDVQAIATGGAAMREAALRAPQVVLLDLLLPDVSGLEVLRSLRATSPSSQVIMLTGQGSIETAVESVRMGAADYLLKPCPLDELRLRVHQALERKHLRERTALLEGALSIPDPGSEVIGESPAFQDLMASVERAAPNDVPVLIQGETGTGKGVVARLLHAHGPRRRRAFVVVECAGLREELLQSELFGHERGAFTGASTAKASLFEVAAGGTIFLDEIGDMTLATQVQLLRVLDDATFRRVGGTESISADVRVLAATHCDLDLLVRQERFREDLLYRLRGINIVTPPLRERTGDVERLAGFYLEQLNSRNGAAKTLTPEAMEALVRYDWPGNVRQLRYMLESAYVMTTGSAILPAHLNLDPKPEPGGGLVGPDGDDGRFPTLEELEQAHLKRALERTAGHRSQAAELLGVSERTLYRMLRRHGIEL